MIGDVLQTRMPARFALRASRPILPGDSAAEHSCLLAFASDLMPMLLVLTRRRIAAGQLAETASLDHAVWFHRPFRADRSLCYDQVAPVAFGGRGR